MSQIYDVTAHFSDGFGGLLSVLGFHVETSATGADLEQEARAAVLAEAQRIYPRYNLTDRRLRSDRLSIHVCQGHEDDDEEEEYI